MKAIKRLFVMIPVMVVSMSAHGKGATTTRAVVYTCPMPPEQVNQTQWYIN
jgi:hypothetical protein